MNLETLLKTVETAGSARLRFHDGRSWQSVDSSQLLADVTGAASRLKNRGVGPGSRVGIQASNCYEWVIHDLALLELRAISVALPDHTDTPPDVLAQTYQLSLLLVAARDGRAADRPWICSIDVVDDGPKSARPPLAPDDDIFSLVLSSGTSGAVKTLMVSRAGAAEVVRLFASRYPMGTDDRLTIFLPLSNFQQRLMVYGALWLGLELVIATPHLLLRSLKEQPPTLFIAPPIFYESVHRRFQAATSSWQRALLFSLAAACRLLPANLRRRVLRALFRPIHEAVGGRIRWMITGMAHIRRSTLSFFRRVGLTLYEAYGLTECGLVAGNFPHRNRPGSVGPPFEEGSVVIAPDGEILVKRRRRVAVGYWNHDPEDARRVFVDQETLATGDIGRFDSDGYLYLTGRKKAMIVTAGGVKIQPEEVENVIRDLPGVEQCAVVGGESLPHLVAVVRMSNDNDDAQFRAVESGINTLNQRLPSGAEIRRTIRAGVPFTIENGLLTRNLKVDRTRVFAHFVEEIAVAQAANASRSAD